MKPIWQIKRCRGIEYAQFDILKFVEEKLRKAIAEKKGGTMKEFDLEKAKAGHPVCTQDGRPARILCFDAKGIPNPIIALIDEGQYERIETYNLDGKYLDEDLNMNCLMMAGVKKEGWVNIFYGGLVGKVVSTIIFSSEEEAFKSADKGRRAGYITTTKIEWEE